MIDVFLSFEALMTVQAGDAFRAMRAALILMHDGRGFLDMARGALA